jgi:microcystin-dependent protein
MKICYLQSKRLDGTLFQNAGGWGEGGMADVFVGQIMMTGFPFAPRGFALCNGQIVSITQNQALFALIGTQYGGNGTTTFQLPDLQGNALYGAGASADPAWQPQAQDPGTVDGSETVTLSVPNLPIHNHILNAVTATGTSPRSVVNTVLATAGHAIYGSPTAGPVQLAPPSLQAVGGNLNHDNMQPFLVINFNISLSGVFPSRN